MTQDEWFYFCKFKEEFKLKILEWSALNKELLILQKSCCQNDTPFYPIENSIVYNTNLDKITKDDTIKLILIGDNPGKNEQLNQNQAYLVGQAGKLANRFFNFYSELQTDFRKNVIILNKTPIHTAKTVHLKYLQKNGSDSVKNLINQSQIWMAKQTAFLHQFFCKNQAEKCQLWLVGYSELKSKGIFELYKNELLKSYEKNQDDWNQVLVFQHFSMNRFTIDLNEFTKNHQNLSLKESLNLLGSFHKNEIFSK